MVRKQLRKYLRKTVAGMLSMFLFISLFAIPGQAAGKEIPDSSVRIQQSAASGLTAYRDYVSALNEWKDATTAVTVSGADFTEEKDSGAVAKEEYESKREVLLWESGRGSVTWTVTIPEDGRYNFEMLFLPLRTGNELEYSLLIDGEILFDGADTLKFTRDWINAANGAGTDADGNEITPEQCETGEYVYRRATDSAGVSVEPYVFGLTAGTHTVTLEGMGYPVAIAEVGFTMPEQVSSYETIAENYEIVLDDSVDPIRIHAEDASVKTDISLVAKATNGDAGMYPVHPYLTKINYIGGTSWQSPGEKLTWTFTVEKAGNYQFGARFKQNELANGESYRWLKIDGRTPFAEAKQLRFPYATGWQYYEMGDGDIPYYIWLEAGEHTVSLEVTLGDLSDIYERFSKEINALGDLYLDIIKITSENPDVNRDYELFRQIPGFNETLTDIYRELESLVEDIRELSGKRGSKYTAAIDNMNMVIKKMLDAPYLAHIYVSDYYTNYTTLCSWMNEMKKMPLALDELQFVYAGQELKWNQPNVFEKIWFSLKRLVYSFTRPEEKQKGTDEETELVVWVNWGRDQATALDTLIRETFTAETGIRVEVKITSASLINGILAGNYPDVQLNLSRTDPVNLGMRGALLDLSSFEDYEEVLGRFQAGADTPYWYQDALYALPDTQTFYCMFYRTDIFEELGLEVPENWGEFLDCATIIRRNNMNVYIPYTQITTATTVNSGIGSLHLYPTLMMQRGLSLYNEEQNATALNTVEAVQVFDEWTDLYTDYGFLKEADFYNRFRNGSMPLGIAPYATYLTLDSAAPEIEGRWTVASVPGTEGGNSWVAGGGTGCAIVKKTEHPEEAWKFLKWWTSAETQTRFCNNVESVLGTLGRVATSNVEAFSNLSWDPEVLRKLLAQWENIREVPEVPGSYYLSRSVDQAFWAVINDNTNPKDAIKKWSEIADNEIARKIRQYE